MLADAPSCRLPLLNQTQVQCLILLYLFQSPLSGWYPSHTITVPSFSPSVVRALRMIQPASTPLCFPLHHLGFASPRVRWNCLSLIISVPLLVLLVSCRRYHCLTQGHKGFLLLSTHQVDISSEPTQLLTTD
ncbi:uncharacterized protein LOC144283320 isoform X3 [Canis aureus]